MKKEDKCSVCGRPYGFINCKITSKGVARCLECHAEYKKISTEVPNQVEKYYKSNVV